MANFYITDTNIEGNDVYITMNKSFGINYMLYLTCQCKNNDKINVVDSEGNTIHFKLLSENDKEKEDLISNIKTILV